MLNPFIAKLRHGAELTGGDEILLHQGIEDVVDVEADGHLARDGERSGVVRLVLEGVACRYKATQDGRTQIMAFLLPGDFCDLHIAVLGAMDHDIKALTRCKVARISTTVVDAWTRHSRVNRALWWATLVDEAVLQQWVVNLGARRADQRIAHLFLELLHRLKTVGLATDKGFALPITQEELGECTGLSTVHVNRVLLRLRDAGLVTFQRHRVAFEDLARTTAMCGFDPAYLHLDDHHPAGPAGQP